VNGEATAGPDDSLLARYEALVRVSRAIHMHRDPKELFGVLAGELSQAADFDFIGLFLYDEASNTLENPFLDTNKVPGFSIRNCPPKPACADGAAAGVKSFLEARQTICRTRP
jgi:hypothetical protein